MMQLDSVGFALRLFAGVVAGLVTWVLACDVGVAALNLLRVPRSMAGRTAVGGALGYALIGSVVAALGLVHDIGPGAGAFVVVIVLVAAYEQRRNLAAVAASARAALERLRSASLLDKAAVGVTGAAVVTGLVAAALPAVWWDPIAYHLPIVARALAQHAFAFDPGMVQTGFPLLAEAAALPAYAIAGSAGAAMSTLGAGIALALVCGAWAERIAAGSGRLATALVACSALWLWLAPSFYVDVPFALFAVCALAIVRLADGDPASGPGIAEVAGAFAGAAAATKYPGLAVCAIALAVVLASIPREQRARALVAFVAGCTAIAAGWYIRTQLLTGDSLYPFLTARFGQDNPQSAWAVRYVTMTQNWCGSDRSVGAALSLPLQLLANPRAFCGDPGYALDLGLIFFIAAFAAFKRVAIPVLSAVVLTAFWFLTSQQWRFLVPAACLFAIVAATGVTVLRPALQQFARAALVSLCAVGVTVNWLPGPAADASNSIAPAFLYITGGESGDAYLSERLESYDAVLWLREHAKGIRVAALDDVRDYYFGPSTLWLNPYYQSGQLSWSSSAGLRYAPVAAAGAHYVVVNANAAFLARSPVGVDWTVLASDEHLGILRKVFSAHDVTVYELTGAK